MYSSTSPSLSGYPKRFVMEIKRTYKTSFTTLSRILRVLPEVDIREIDQALDEIDKLLFSLPLNNKGYRVSIAFGKYRPEYERRISSLTIFLIRVKSLRNVMLIMRTIHYVTSIIRSNLVCISTKALT